MARGFIQGYVERGGQTVSTDGRTSTTQVQRSFPGATVKVYNAGTVVLATIFSTEGGAPKSNPFVADSDGKWFFWADQARYDVEFSGAGITSPYTIFNLEPLISTTGLSDPGASGFVFRTTPGITIIADALIDPEANGIVVRTAEDTTVARTIQGTTSAIVVTNGNGVAGNPSINLDTNLNFVGKTIDGGTYVSPGIANFQNALHLHETAMGGGQLNATNVFSAGTVPVARLPIMVGATGVTPGVAGLVPAPIAGDDDLFLRGDGTWQAAGGGGGGTPSSPNLSLQYNNGGAFGGVTGTSSDGTQVTWSAGVLRTTSPRITTNILDTNGNVIVTLNAVGTAVNNFQIANAASGGHPVFSAVGAGSDINVVLTPKGAGIVDTAGNFRITNNAPTITLVDANDSKTFRVLLSGSNFSLINDTLASTPLNIDTTNNAVTLVGSLTTNGDVFVTKNNPQITLTHAATGQLCNLLIDATNFYLYKIPGQDIIFADLTTRVVGFGVLPTIPTTTPTTSGQVVSKNTLDNALLPFSINFYEYDPSASSTGTDDRPGFVIPDNVQGGTITKAFIHYVSGTAMAGGTSIVFQFRKWSAGGGASDWANITVTSSHGSNSVHSFDIADLVLTGGDLITYYISSRTGTINPRGMVIALQGTWKRTNP